MSTSRRRRNTSYRARKAAHAAVVILALGGCGGSGHGAPAAHAPPRMRLASPAFVDRGALPRRFTCDGPGVSPPLTWSGVPRNTAELALLVEDPDSPGGTFLHWALYDVPPRTSRLVAGRVPVGARQGQNGFGNRGYGAPCPPRGDPQHRYVFTLYALGRRSGLRDGASPGAVRAAIARAATGKGELTATYAR